MTYDGKSYVEKSVAVEEKPRIFVTPRGTEFKLVLGGFIQMNLEDGAVSAFEGRFGQTALQDRFRLRRARINLTGDFAENFDFKVEGDFEQSDGTSATTARIFQPPTSSLTGISFRKRRSRLANGKRHSAWSSSHRILPYSFPSAAFLPARLRPTGRSARNFGESRLPTSGLRRRIC